MSLLAWGKRTTPEFHAKVQEICEEFGWDENKRNWLMACMAFESAETFSPSILNAAGSGAVGLIQFMPATAHSFGTTTLELSRMTAVQQLEYVRRHFRPYAKRIKSLSDMYMTILMPKYVGAEEDCVLFSHGVSYRQNSGLDANHDGKITKAEAAACVLRKLKTGLSPIYACNL